MTPPPVAFRPLLVSGAILACLAVSLSGCGEQGTAAPDKAETRRAGPEAKPPFAAQGCPRQLGGFVRSLETLRRQLAVGLAYDQYVERVKRLRSSYEEIPVERLTFDCLATGTPGERALNEHIDAANAWGECLADASCTTTTIEPVLQRKWRVASRRLSEAR